MASRPLHQLDDPATFASAERAFVDAALAALSNRRDLDFNVSEVIRASGWHNAAFYRVFGSKERLLVAVAEEAMSRTLAPLRRRTEAAASPHEALRVWATVLLKLAGTAKAAGAVESFALERHRFLRRFPDSDERLASPVKQVLLGALERFGVAGPLKGQLLTHSPIGSMNAALPA